MALEVASSLSSPRHPQGLLGATEVMPPRLLPLTSELTGWRLPLIITLGTLLAQVS